MSSQTADTTGRAALAAAPDYCRCDTLVLGCGNELFGDDGFGPAVARRLADSQDTPRSVVALDVGTSVRQVLFNVVLSPYRPRRIVVVDAVDQGRRPGEVWTMKARDLPQVKCDDFSMHQLPTSNLLRELDELGGVEVTCVVAQVSPLPPEVRPGLSAPIRRAVPLAVEMILEFRQPGAKARGAAGGAPLEEQSHG
jgi:coenzyme F420 hydrogenase subunit delta